MARTDDRRGTYRVLVGRPQAKRLFGRPRCGWEDNIEINVQEMGRRNGVV